MPSARFSALARQLIDAGIASKYVVRLRQELDDHHADLVAELRRERSAPQARADAARRIGNLDVIFAEFAKRPELKSFVYRSQGLIRVLRLVAVLVLATRQVLHWLAEHTPALTRLATAAAVAVIVTGSLLLIMSAVTMSEWLRPVQHVSSRVAATEKPTPAGPPASASKPPPIHVSLPDPIREVAPELRAVAWSTEVSVEAHPGPMVFPRPSDSEYHPIVQSTPEYPALAASRGIEGYVVVEFTVTRTGSVKDVVVIESSDELFVEAAVEATYKNKYTPRVIDGEPIEVSGVRNRISFKVRA